MANVIVDKASLQNAANSIRSKTGKNGLITPEEFSSEIDSISGGGSSLTGTYKAKGDIYFNSGSQSVDYSMPGRIATAVVTPSIESTKCGARWDYSDGRPSEWRNNGAFPEYLIVPTRSLSEWMTRTGADAPSPYTFLFPANWSLQYSVNGTSYTQSFGFSSQVYGAPGYYYNGTYGASGGIGISLSGKLSDYMDGEIYNQNQQFCGKLSSSALYDSITTGSIAVNVEYGSNISLTIRQGSSTNNRSITVNKLTSATTVCGHAFAAGDYIWQYKLQNATITDIAKAKAFFSDLIISVGNSTIQTSFYNGITAIANNIRTAILADFSTLVLQNTGSIQLFVSWTAPIGDVVTGAYNGKEVNLSISGYDPETGEYYSKSGNYKVLWDSSQEEPEDGYYQQDT